MMVTGIQSSANSADTTTTPAASGASKSMGLGRDAFMKLMLTQMRQQDPLNPVSNTDFLAQLAQFNALEEMVQLNQTMTNFVHGQQLSQASALIGKQASGLDKQGLPVSGVVSEVHVAGDEVMLTIGASQLALSSVHSVEEVPADVS